MQKYMNHLLEQQLRFYDQNRKEDYMLNRHEVVKQMKKEIDRLLKQYE